MPWFWVGAGASVLYGSIGLINASNTTYRVPKRLIKAGKTGEEPYVSMDDVYKDWMKKWMLNVVAWPVRQDGDDVDVWCRHDSDSENTRADEIVNGFTRVRCVVPVRNRTD